MHSRIVRQPIHLGVLNRGKLRKVEYHKKDKDKRPDYPVSGDFSGTKRHILASLRCVAFCIMNYIIWNMRKMSSFQAEITSLNYIVNFDFDCKNLMPSDALNELTVIPSRGLYKGLCASAEA